MKKFIPFLAVGIVAAVVLVGLVGFVGYRTVNAMAAPVRANVAANLYFAASGNSTTAGQDLANALGIDLTKLQDAVKAAWTEALKEAVAAGKLTQAQADQMAARVPVNAMLGRESAWFTSAGIDFNSLLAKQLNISVDQLTAAYQKAYYARIDQAVKDGNMTQEQADLAKARYALETSTKFQDTLKSAFEGAVNQAVKDGLITQSQADQILKNNTGNFFGRGFGEPGLRGFGGGMGFPGGKGFGGHGGRGGFGNNKTNPANPTSPNTPTSPTPTPGSGL